MEEAENSEAAQSGASGSVSPSSLGCSVAEAQRRVSSAEFTEWMAFSGWNRLAATTTTSAGTVAAMVANVHRNEKVRAKPFEPLDFAPWNDHHQRADEPEPILLPDKEAQSLLIETMMFPRRE